MATMLMQKDLVLRLKKETNLNIGLLSKLHPMDLDFSSVIFKNNALEKPTQNLFNHLSYYLVSIIDNDVYASLPWPLYDTKVEKAYRNKLASFITNYSSKGLLTHVMSSYLVNPGSYKVTVLIFQLSQLAVNRSLMSKLVKDSKKSLYNTVTDKYKSQEKDGFVDCIEKETDIMLSKFSKYLSKRKVMEQIAFLFRKKITEMESKLNAVNGQRYIDNIVDSFIKNHSIDDEYKDEILNIKNIYQESSFFENWLKETDQKLNAMEREWNERVPPLLTRSKNVLQHTEDIINIHTGQMKRSSYMIEYNHKTDFISTTELQKHVNSQQKYILRNLDRDGVQNFPNLIRAFVISMCYILKNNEVGDEIYNFNKYLDGGKRNYGEVVGALNVLIARVMNAESKLMSFPQKYEPTKSVNDHLEIPPVPDLSDLKANRHQYQVFLDTFTPLNLYRHQFNLRRRTSGNFVKPISKSLTANMFQSTRDDFLKSLTSCRIGSYDGNTTQNIHNKAPMSNIKINETISDCGAGFTKQQIYRLLSTKKSSSSKKFKLKQDRGNINIVKGGLFNESINSIDSNGGNLFRCYSSPNLYDCKEKMLLNKVRARKLSITKEDSPQIDVSGIACLEPDSICNSLNGLGNGESSRQTDTPSIPNIFVTKEAENRINNVLNEVKVDLSNNLGVDSTISPIQEVTRKSIELDMASLKVETPKTNTSLIKKSSSLEKIINRYKKVRANIVPQKKTNLNDINTIVEEKENLNHDSYTANRILLPDLLSPNWDSNSSSVNVDFLDQVCSEMDEVDHGKPRLSLGTALGVDNTFLDQFELID